jgi:hypothetical protein
VRSLQEVPSDRTADADPADPADLADLADMAARLAAALRAVRGYVPHRIWWETDAADALIAYQATHSA